MPNKAGSYIFIWNVGVQTALHNTIAEHAWTTPTSEHVTRIFEISELRSWDIYILFALPLMHGGQGK